ncbi:MAG TPA: hypothetical protein VKA68_16905 [bacterium]|nr:hypothetical protein [bacterium]
MANQLMDHEQGPSQKSSSKSMLYWLLYVAATLPLAFFGTFFFIVLFQLPSGMTPESGVQSDSAAVAASDSMTAARGDSSLGALDSTQTDTIQGTDYAIVNGEILERESGSKFALEAAEIESAQENESDTTKKPDYKQLAKIYSQMETNAAANILSRLDDTMVVGILKGMRDRYAAELLSAIEPERAAILSEKLSRAQNTD